MPKKDIKKALLNNQQALKGSTLALVATKENCNLRCRYCYEKHEMRDNEIMRGDVAKEIVSQHLRADNDYNMVGIEFFGGEPFIAFSFIREIVDWTISQKWPKAYNFLIGTNGTILDEEMKEWLSKNKNWVDVSLSLDGNKTAHDLNRDNSYDLVVENLAFFADTWPHQAAKMTVTAETIPHVADSIIELEEKGVYFTANVVFEDIWGDADQKKELLDIYEEQLERLVEYYADRPHLFPVYPMLAVVPEYLGLPDYGQSMKKEIKRYCGAGHEMAIVDVDGQVYPCHRFLPWISSNPAPAGPTNCQDAWKPDECADCKLVLSCPTCAGYNWECNNDTAVRTTFHCDAYKLEVIASAKLEALRMGRKTLAEIENMGQADATKFKKRLKAVIDLAENGV